MKAANVQHIVLYSLSRVGEDSVGASVVGQGLIAAGE